MSRISQAKTDLAIENTDRVIEIICSETKASTPKFAFVTVEKFDFILDPDKNDIKLYK